ncbi:MAG: T9SS type A sorting domain-containing protein [Tannerellaceae bacterium]|jgi:hypothetical protein|nr:T9SS type A sorting domain-containing protein [Tannerellaceae bacterium]
MSSLADFDSYFQSYGYTRSSATESNAAIALWSHNGSFTHASVRKNNTITKPHGFEWESKCGSLERVMHIKDAVSGTSYGTIAYYYRPINNNASNSLTQPANESYFSKSELDIIKALKEQLHLTVKSGFDNSYFAWKETWSKPEIAIFSNPRKYAESEEYNDLLKYCKKYGKAIWPLLIDKLAEGDVFVGNLLEDLTYSGKGTLTGDFIATLTVENYKPLPSTNSILVDYSKKLLEKEMVNIQKSIQDTLITDKESFEVDATVNGQKILVTVKTDTHANISMKIYDYLGTIVYEGNSSITEGEQKFVINAANFRKGLHIVSININNKLVSKKINI